MMKCALMAACAAFVLLTACRSGEDGTAMVSAEYVAAAEKAVADALLTTADLPPGWSAEPQDDDESEIEFTGECESFNQNEFPGEVASADSDELSGPNDQLLFTSAIAFPSDANAEGALAEFVMLPRVCREQLEDGFVKTFQDSLASRGADDVEVSVSVEDLQFQEFGSGQGAYRVNWSYAFQGREVGGLMDFVFWRQGKMLGGFVYMTSGDPSMAEELQLATFIDDKLTRAEATLSN